MTVQSQEGKKEATNRIKNGVKQKERAVGFKASPQFPEYSEDKKVHQ